MGRIELIQAAAQSAEALYTIIEDRNTALEEVVQGEEATRNPLKKVKGAAKKIGGIKGEVEDSIKYMKDVREAKKDLAQKRSEVLDNATLQFSLIDYAKGTQREGRDNRLLDVFDVTQIEGVCGAFVIATYKRIDLDKDHADYKGVYVGKGEDIRAEIDHVISRAGDPDVYADVKYYQNVKFYLFDCLPEDLETFYDGLLKGFADERLYNLREDDAIVFDGDIAGDDAGATGDPEEASFVVVPMDEAPAEEAPEEEAPAEEAPAEDAPAE